MAEPRRIVLILGNGFDLDLGLKTSYKDFWESEDCPNDYPSPLIHHLNERWPDNLEAVKWYDLENELLAYYNGIRDLKSPKDILSAEEMNLLRKTDYYNLRYPHSQEIVDLVRRLYSERVLYNLPYDYRPHSDYLEDLVTLSPVDRDKKALDLIKERLCKYLQTVKSTQINKESIASRVISTLCQSVERGDFVSIYSFNYTFVNLPFAIDERDVQYVHGSCASGRIIIGTRDDENYNENYDFLQKSFDPAFNPPSIVPDLLEADEVVIFGHSIGENDRQYFKPLFKLLSDTSNPHMKSITIFTKDSNSEIQIKRAMQRMTDGNLATLYSINQPSVIKTCELNNCERSLYDFFVNHGIEDRPAREAIGTLLSQYKS